MPPHTAELREALEAILSRNHVPGLPVVAIERCPSAYRSSYPLEELRVSLGGGAALELIFKDLSRESMSEAARRAKPEFLHNPLREIEAYRALLAGARLETPHCYGAAVDGRIGRYWLFLEKVPGDELYKIGDFSIWESAARWLARMHQQFAAQNAATALRSVHWLKCDADFFRMWMRRAHELTSRSGASGPPGARRNIARLAVHYDRVVERLAALPATFIHGEFYASNILIAHGNPGRRVCPIDWEMAAVGPGLIDLAALISGRWSEAQQTALACAYYASLADTGGPGPLREEQFLKAIDICRLHLAVQWLGWSDNWTPPADHAHDWLAEALHLAEKVGCL